MFCGPIIARWKKHLWNSVIFCYLLSGTWSQINVVQQPDVVLIKLCGNAMLNCVFTHTPDMKVSNKPILYWEFMSQNKSRLFPNQEPQYNGRVDVLDDVQSSPNKSILFRNVRWEDSGKYQCMLSYERDGDSERKRGAGVKLLIYDSAIFDVLPESKDQLRCAINVSQDPGLNLSMYHNGVPIDTRRNDTLFSPFRQLSVYIPLKEAGNYECKLNLASKLILNRNYSYYPEEKILPEPWILYVAIVSIPFTGILILLTACVFKFRSRGAS
ncbi:uncharacterized protein LOC124472394 [Hypomesus transpacificus]|uniref:uncharacterized protein LOC124472394 n=1 Tax=Hypomesus transpacificus TaxID=137520 RepID=UPI001F073867|nr:uncharacterized protein LOC124472394 [Hypomesus transpacificus]